MMEQSSSLKPWTLLRLAVVFVLAGTFCAVIFLLSGFTAWSVGLGFFLGVPLLLTGMLLYIIAVVRDLRERGAL